jgi:hypothetical protein
VVSYVDAARTVLTREMPDEAAGLVDLYLLLAMCKGVDVTARDVHHAWAIWRSRAVPAHAAIVLFDDLPPEKQRLDDPYVEAIRRASWAMAR